jgi:nucleotide-binding universal stress UspA family protein
MKILVGYDGSAPSKNALDLALKHALSFGATVDVLTSIEKGTGTQEQEIEKAEQNLVWAKSLFSEKNVPCMTHLLNHGIPPGEDIVEFAHDHKINEILIGVKPRSKLKKLLMCSTAHYVVLQAGCPVVAVK